MIASGLPPASPTPVAVPLRVTLRVSDPLRRPVSGPEGKARRVSQFGLLLDPAVVAALCDLALELKDESESSMTSFPASGSM